MTENDNRAGDSRPRRRLSTVWIIVLAILAIPVGVPLILGLGGGLIGLVVGLGSAAIAVVIAAVSAVVAGIVAVVTFPIALLTDFGSAMLSAGNGLISIGVGILMLMGMFWLFRHLVRLVKSLIKKLSRRDRDGQQAV